MEGVGEDGAGPNTRSAATSGRGDAAEVATGSEELVAGEEDTSDTSSVAGSRDASIS